MAVNPQVFSVLGVQAPPKKKPRTKSDQLNFLSSISGQRIPINED